MVLALACPSSSITHAGGDRKTAEAPCNNIVNKSYMKRRVNFLASTSMYPLVKALGNVLVLCPAQSTPPSGGFKLCAIHSSFVMAVN